MDVNVKCSHGKFSGVKGHQATLFKLRIFLLGERSKPHTGVFNRDFVGMSVVVQNA